ncbi:MAG: endonuclease/exonuclease/phosphatase family protein [Roseovarius sp.]
MAETLRIATFHTELSRKGPGLLLRDILKGDPQAEAVAEIVAHVAPDVLILQGVDYDHGQATLGALRDLIGAAGATYPHMFALQPNSGMASGHDLDGDGRLGEPEDAQGYGWFAGEGGMAILSRHPVAAEGVRDFSDLLWADMPGEISDDGMNAAVQRLSSVGHWVVPVRVGDRRLNLLTFHATPPVFDGPEDRNGRRNHDEITVWQRYLDRAFGPVAEGAFVLAGNANLDPVDGDGRKGAITGLLDDPRLQDPAPRRAGAAVQGEGQQGDPALDTVAWSAPTPGHLRVSYVLPAAGLEVVGSGVFWPDDGDPLAEAARTASRHRVVWVDLRID